LGPAYRPYPTQKAEDIGTISRPWQVLYAAFPGGNFPATHFHLRAADCGFPHTSKWGSGGMGEIPQTVTRNYNVFASGVTRVKTSNHSGAELV